MTAAPFGAADALLVACVLFYMTCFRDISNAEFLVIAAILGAYLCILVCRARRRRQDAGGREGFVDGAAAALTTQEAGAAGVEEEAEAEAVAEEEDGGEGERDQGHASIGRLDEGAYRNSLFALPLTVRDILVPRLDYVVRSVKGGSGAPGGGGGDDDDGMVNLEETEFIANKDPDVMVDGEVDKDRMHRVLQDYLDVDAALTRLQQLDERLHADVVGATAS